MKNEKNSTNKMLAVFAAVFVIGVISMIGAYAYKGDPSVQGPNYDADVHEQLEAAIDAGDYEAWIKIRQDNNLPMNGRMFQVINKDNFQMFVDMHDANLAGDTAKANEIRSSLGLGQGMMKGKMQGSTGCNMQAAGAMNCGGAGQMNQQFVDLNNDGVCDNYALHHAQI